MQQDVADQLTGVGVAQAVLGAPVDELAHHYGFNPHVGLLRGWALALPAAAVWWLLVRPATLPRPGAARRRRRAG